MQQVDEEAGRKGRERRYYASVCYVLPPHRPHRLVSQACVGQVQADNILGTCFRRPVTLVGEISLK